MLLTLLTFLGLVAGVFIGQYLLFDPANPIGENHWTRQAGELVLVRPLMWLVIPLILAGVPVGMARMGNPARIALVGGASILYFAVTMLVASALGVMLASAYPPAALPAEVREELRLSAAHQYDEAGEAAHHLRSIEEDDHSQLGSMWMAMLHRALPANLIDEMTQGHLLGVIVLAFLLGMGFVVSSQKNVRALEFFEALLEVLLRVARGLAWMAPIGVMFFAAFTIGRIGLPELYGPLGRYIAVVIGGLAIYGWLVLPLLLVLLTRRNPYGFMWQARKALLTALGTSSSLASLPVSIDTAIHEGWCSRPAATIVLPLGAVINRSGTALYAATGAMFLFQLDGVPLGFSDVVIIIITSALASVAAAGLPWAGLTSVLIVIIAVNTSLAGRGVETLPTAILGVIIAVDRVLDMCRSAVNVWSDLVAARIVSEIARDESMAKTHAIGQSA